MTAHSLQKDDVVEVINASGHAPLVLVCEHASCFIPADLDHLGLAPAARQSHAAWDPGARALAVHLSARFDAKCVASRISRLVYDCNRPPEASDAIPARSEVIEVPGNAALSTGDRRTRVNTYYAPFHETLASVLDATRDPVIVTVHSFTPVYHGRRREVEIGVLHDSDSRLADAILSCAEALPFEVQRNAPYGPQDGVTHTLKSHGIPKGRLNVMLEVRNDLIATAAQQAEIAATLGDWLAVSFRALQIEELMA